MIGVVEPPLPSSTLQVVAPLRAAYDHARRLLFRPIQPEIWMTFGAIFFLASLVEEGASGGAANVRLPSRGGWGVSGSDFVSMIRTVRGWASEHLDTLLTVGAVVLVVVVALGVLSTWFGTRGELMALRAVSLADPNFRRNWSETSAFTRSLFLTHLAIGVPSGALALGVLALIAVRAFELLDAGTTAPVDYAMQVLPLGLLLVAVLLAASFVRFVVQHFVAPLMLHFRVSARATWPIVSRIFASSPLEVAGYVGVRMVIGVAISVVGSIVSLLTCCVGALPILHQALVAPLLVFDRAYTLEVLSTLGPEFRMIAPIAGAPVHYPLAPR